MMQNAGCFSNKVQLCDKYRLIQTDCVLPKRQEKCIWYNTLVKRFKKEWITWVNLKC